MKYRSCHKYDAQECKYDFHFERDFEKMRSFKSQGWQNATALFGWINSAFDDSGVEDQERLLEMVAQKLPSKVTHAEFETHCAEKYTAWKRIEGNDPQQALWLLSAAGI